MGPRTFACNGGHFLFVYGPAPMHFSPHLFAILALAAFVPQAWANMYKCTDAQGHSTYSDRACALGPKPAPPPPPAAVATPAAKKPAAVAVKPFADGKLTVAAVESVVRQAADMAERSDYRGQCALAGPEVTFKVTDHSTTPATVLSGGRREICAAQRDSAQAVDAMGLKATVRTGKLAVALNPDSTKATVKYESATTLTHQGQVVMQLKCVREEVLGVYDGEILYAQALATCRPQ